MVTNNSQQLLQGDQVKWRNQYRVNQGILCKIEKLCSLHIIVACHCVTLTMSQTWTTHTMATTQNPFFTFQVNSWGALMSKTPVDIQGVPKKPYLQQLYYSFQKQVFWDTLYSKSNNLYFSFHIIIQRRYSEICQQPAEILITLCKQTHYYNQD